MIFSQAHWTLRRCLLPLILMLAVATPCWSVVRAGVDGGLMNAGITGRYFPNGHFAGQPAFTRHDDRVDFNWGRYRPIGGSNTPKYHNFPRDNFSVRWSGRVLSHDESPFRLFDVSGSPGWRRLPGAAARMFVVYHANSTRGRQGGLGWVRIHKRTGSMTTARRSGRIQPDLNARGGGNIQRLGGNQDITNTLPEPTCHGGQRAKAEFGILTQQTAVLNELQNHVGYLQ